MFLWNFIQNSVYFFNYFIMSKSVENANVQHTISVNQLNDMPINQIKWSDFF